MSVAIHSERGLFMRLDLNAKKKWSLPFVSVAMIIVLSITSFATSTIEELDQESAVLDEQIGEANDETSSLEEQLSEINSELLEIYEELEAINDKIELTESQMGKTLDDLTESKLAEEQQYENMKVRIRYMYEAGDTTFLEMIFGAESLIDFVNKVEFISSVTEYDREMLVELTEIRENIEFEEANLLDEQTALVDLQVEAELAAAELQEKADETETDLVSVQSLIESLEAEQNAIAEEKAELEQKAAEEAAAAEAAAAEAAKREEEAAQKEAEEAQKEAETSTSNNGSDYSANTSELDLFAAILDCEAQADYSAMLAVATVIMNRVESSNYPNSVTKVVYESGQFSPTWTGKLDRKLASGASDLAYEVAQDALDGKRLDSVSNCYYFLYSASSSRDGVVIGGNVFFVSW